MAGIDTYEDGVGYKHIKIKPAIGGGFTYASASLQTYYGKVSSGWKVAGDSIYLDIEIPANTSATVFIPATNARAVTESNRPLSALTGNEKASMDEGYVSLKLGSGVYHFATLKNKDVERVVAP
jgi:alpha-L-rhamnosidase